MHKRLYFIVLFLILSISSVLAQKDYREGFIVSSKNDTIYGQVAYRFNVKNYESCLFKSDQGEVSYFPNQINGFGYINGKLFSSQVVSGTFVEVLVLGEISLYRSKDKFHLQKDGEVYELEHNKFKALNNSVKEEHYIYKENSKWRGIITYLISDCLNKGQEFITRLRFDEKSLTRLVVQYNKCKGTSFNEIKSDKPWSKVGVGASLGVNSTTIHSIKNTGYFFYFPDSYQAFGPSVGLVLNVSFPKVNDKLAFQGELQYSQVEFSSFRQRQRMGTEYFETYIGLTTLSLPLSLKYTFPLKKFDFYLQGGYNLDYHLSSKTKMMSEVVKDNVVYTNPEEEALEIRKRQNGYFVGIGIQKSFNKFSGSIAIRYFSLDHINESIPDKRAVNLPYAGVNRFAINLIIVKK